MSVLPPFALARPTTVDEALALIGEDALPYAGGTEALVAMRAGLLRPATLVDLKRLPALAVVDVVGTALHVGATATHHDVARHPAVVGRLPMLADVLRHVGNARVRAQGTLVGNVCFAEPRSDVATALIALDARVVIRSATGERRVPVEGFVLGPFATDREPDELVVRVEIPLAAERRAIYLKYQIAERPTIGVAAAEWEAGGDLHRLVVVGAVAERPAAFGGSAGEEIDPDAIAHAVEPIADLTGSEDYKRHLTAVFVRRALTALAVAA